MSSLGIPIAELRVESYMRKLLIVLSLAAALGACANKNALDIPTGTDVTVEKTDGVTVAGRLVEIQPDHVIVESRAGVKTSVPRTLIASIHPTPAAAAMVAAAAVDERKATTPSPAAPEAAAPAPVTPASALVPDDKVAAASDARPAVIDDRPTATAGIADRKPEYREVTLPAGTTLTVALTSMVGSDTSKIEDPVHGTLRHAVRIDGLQALPIGTAVSGHVTHAQPAGKVKGKASIGFRINTIELPGKSREPIKTATYSRVSRATKQKDATKIGVGAGAGAVIGGILGGGSGAAKGAVLGGGAGTGVVLATKGDEVRIPAGTLVTIRLTAPLIVQVRVK
jgi:hypothetical protein